MAMTIGKLIPVVIAFGVGLVAWRMLGGSDYLEELTTKGLQEEYDYIIVGAGTSGGVIAARLAADGSKSTIALIEAGEDPKDNPDILTPLDADRVRGSKFDWNYHTIPQKFACKSHVDKESVWPSGKGLGGTSNLNYMMYLRGSRHDFDGWASQGASGWSYKDVLPYFIKSEDNRNNEYTRTVFHGYGGRLTVSDATHSPLNLAMIRSFKEIGLKSQDINGRNIFGYFPLQATIRDGERCGTYRSFIKSVLYRPNVHLETKAVAQKVIFEGRKAVGVVFKKKDQLRTVRAKKDVILAAGTVGTAKLLMLSGVGPKQHLKEHKIPVIVDLPVGNNLQDHVMSDALEFYTPFRGFSVTAAKAENFVQSWSYALFGTGMKSSPRYREGIVNLKMRNHPPHIKYPLVSLHIVSNIGVYSAAQLNVDEESYDGLHSKQRLQEGFSVFVNLLHPRSKGNVRLASDNPEDPPMINPNYLADDVDVKYLVDGVKFARKLASLTPIQEWELKLNERLFPPCEKFGNYTTAYIECWVRHVTLSGYAPVGTCKMGAVGDPSTVVDPQLRVKGLKNLRVADASIIPDTMTGNTYATQVMIGEKAADIIAEKDTVQAIREYFKHLLEIKHERMREEEEQAHDVPAENGESEGTTGQASTPGKKSKKPKKK